MRTPEILPATPSLFDHAITLAGERSSREQLAAALLAALALLRKMIGEHYGYGPQRSFDTLLKTKLITCGLDHIRHEGRARTAALPAISPNLAASVILEDAVRNCMLINPDQIHVETAGAILLEHLIETLGAPPDFGQLLDRIRTGEQNRKPPGDQTVSMQ